METLPPCANYILMGFSHKLGREALSEGKIPQKDAFSSSTKRARGERMNGRVRVVRRIHDEAITTFFAGEVMCY